MSKSLESISTTGRTLDYAASLYDTLEPLLLYGKQGEMNDHILELLSPVSSDRILDVGCGTGLLTKKIAGYLNHKEGGIALGIDAAGKMIETAREKRESVTCKFDVAVAEELPYEDGTFDQVVSTFFFPHVNLELKEKALKEIFRTLKSGGQFILLDMHKPTTLLGAVTSHISRWLLFQPQIGENIRGVLPDLINTAGFADLKHITTYLGYTALFVSRKPCL